MLSYRHAYHAGNAADVLKHAVVTFAVDYLQQKPKPLYLLDTHAGAGLYDLGSEQAAKTGEAEAGIRALLDVPGPRPALFERYDALVRDGLRRDGAYPGSPALLARLKRPDDRVELCELHPTDHGLLRGHFARQDGVRVARQDGFQAMIARVPPPERRGLVVIDPSYEIKSDYDTVVTRLAQAHRRFATGVYVLWYPVIDRVRTETFLGALRTTGIRRQLRIEFCPSADTPERGMTGSGLVVINPPYGLEEAAGTGLPWLGTVLGAAGGHTVTWLVPE